MYDIHTFTKYTWFVLPKRIIMNYWPTTCFRYPQSRCPRTWFVDFRITKIQSLTALMVSPPLENSKRTAASVTRSEHGPTVQVKISGILSDAWGIAMWTMWAVAAWHHRVKCPLSTFSYSVWYFLEGCHTSWQLLRKYPKGHLCFQAPIFSSKSEVRKVFQISLVI